MPITDQHENYVAALPRWRKNRDFIGGSDAVKYGECAQEYLPLLSGETDDAYKVRKLRAVYYPAPGRTRAALVGSLLRKDPVLQLPDAARPHTWNIDLAGTPYEVFRAKVLRELLDVGRVAVFEDWSQEQKRPFWTIIAAEQLDNWRTGVSPDGVTRPVYVKILDEVEERSDDGFGRVCKQRYRTLEIVEGVVQYRRYFKNDETGEFEEDSEAAQVLTKSGVPMTEIPIEIFGCEDLGPDVQRTPLSDVVDLTHDHYLLSSDHRAMLHGGIPILNIFGDTEEHRGPLLVGTAGVNRFDKDARVEFCEMSGSPEHIKSEMAADEDRLALIGARMLSRPKAMSETADALRITQGGENATLSDIATIASTGFTRLWEMHVAWMGGDISTVSESFNKDFVAKSIAPELVARLMEMNQAGKLSTETLLEVLAGNEAIPHDAQTELERIAADSTMQGEALNLDLVDQVDAVATIAGKYLRDPRAIAAFTAELQALLGAS